MIENFNQRMIVFIFLFTFIFCQQEYDTQSSFSDQDTEITKVFSQQDIITNAYADDLIIIPINMKNKDKTSNQFLGQQQMDTNRIVLIQVKVTSSLLFHAYIREQGSYIHDKLESVDGIHFYGYRQAKNNQIEVVLLNTDMTILESNNNKGEDQTLNYINLSYRIDVIPHEQNACPFNCFNRGFCQPNGLCLCEEGYSQLFNCQLKMESQPIEFDKTTRIYELNNDENIVDTEYQWKYTKIELIFNEAIKKQIQLKQQIKMKPQTVSILFKAHSKPSNGDHKLILLEENKSFTILQTNDLSDKNVFIANYEMKYSEFQISSYTNLNRGISIIVGHKDLKSIEVCVRINYEAIHNIFEIFSIIFVIVVTIFVISLIIVIVSKSKYIFGGAQEITQVMDFSLDQSSSQLTAEQTNQQIQREMPSFLFQTPNDQQELNGTHYECFICLNKYENQDECRKTRCGHVFHKECIDAWLQKNYACPVDRKSLIIKT